MITYWIQTKHFDNKPLKKLPCIERVRSKRKADIIIRKMSNNEFEKHRVLGFVEKKSNKCFAIALPFSSHDVYIHELGHCLQSEPHHSKDPNSLMYPGSPPGNWFTPEDLEEMDCLD